MRLQMAPMEGITNYVYRNAHARHFGKMDKYYTPFLSLHKEKEFNHKEMQEILPEHNRNLNVIPQVLTNSAEDFLRGAEKLNAFGYEEVNINMGCPSATVVTKAKGAGMLAETEKLERFLDEIFAKTPMDISIKTRLGMESAEEWEKLLQIYNQYPIKELTVHARVRTDFYQNKPNWDAFAYAMKNSKNPICYNGDIFSVDDYRRFKKGFSESENIMLGRGLLANPFLAEEIYQDVNSTVDEITIGMTKDKVNQLQAFHDELYNEYRSILSGEQNVLFKMKEIWTYMNKMWPGEEKLHKAIRKAKKCSEYEQIVHQLFMHKTEC